MALSGMKSPRMRTTAAVLAVVALALALYHTVGMRSTFDSVRYANVGHWIEAGEGISASVLTVPVQEGTPATGDGLHAFTLHPPGLSIFYAMTGVEHRLVAHRVLHVICYVVLALVVLVIARELMGGAVPAALVTLLTLNSPYMLDLVRNLWSDLPFTVLLLGGLAATMRAVHERAHWWRWLLVASACAGLAVGFRLLGLALGAVFLVDAALGVQRRGWRHGLLRLAAAGAVAGPMVTVIILRNLRLAGAFGGTVPRDWPLVTTPSVLRAWNFVSSRLLEAFMPGFATRETAEYVAAANANPRGWVLAGVTVFALVLVGFVVAFLRQRGKVAWPDATLRGRDGVTWLAVTLAATYLVLVLVPVTRHMEVVAVEARYFAPVLPLLWVPVVIVLFGSGRRWLDLGLGGVVTAIFLVGAVAMHEPYDPPHGALRSGLDWLEANVPVTTPILTNGGKVLLDEKLARRVYHLSDWNFKAVLPQDMRTEDGLRRYLEERGIGYIVLFGRPDRRKAYYWGEAVTGLLAGRRWGEFKVYGDRRMKIYRVPGPGEVLRSPKRKGRP